MRAAWIWGRSYSRIPREWTNYKFSLLQCFKKLDIPGSMPIKRKSMGPSLGLPWRESLKNAQSYLASQPLWRQIRALNSKTKCGQRGLKNKTWNRNSKKSCAAGLKKRIHNSVVRLQSCLNIHRPKGQKSGGYEIALKLAVEKLNNTVSRKTRRAAVDWKPEDFLKRTKRYNRKIKAVPKRKVHRAFSLEDRVRLMQKQAVDKGGFYKSYEGTRSKFHRMWSTEIYLVTKKEIKRTWLWLRIQNQRRRSGLDSSAGATAFTRGRLVHLQLPKPTRKKKKPAAPVRARRGMPSKLGANQRLKRGFPPKARSVIGSDPPALRRSTRVRRKPVRYQ